MTIWGRRAKATLGALFAAVWMAGCGGDGGTGPTQVCSTASAPLQVGQVGILDASTVASCAFLEAAGGTAEYLVVPFTANFEEPGSFVVTVQGSEVAFEPARAAPRAPSAADAFHARVRLLEARMAQRGLAPARASSDAGLFSAPTVGQPDSFWVIQNLDADFLDPQPGDFQRIGATLKFIGTNTLLYLDDEAPAGGFTDPELDGIGRTYDEKLYGLSTQTFGLPSDVDGGGRVTILLSPYVNALTPPGDSAVIVGFFFGLDLVDAGEPDCPVCAFSNEQEMFYGIVPDTDGLFGDPRGKESVQQILPPVFVHETQHLISFNQRVFLRNGLPEVLWLNEALSHIAEELGGDLFEAEGDATTASDYYDQNFLRSIPYLEEPWNHSLTAAEGGGTLEERGAGWFFLRWLGDQYGSSIYGRLVQTTDLGSVNVENRTRVDFFPLFGEWVVTLYSEDLTIPNLSDRFQIPKWDLRSILTSGGSYALQPVARTFSNLRGAGLTQTLKGSSPYHLLVSADGSGDLSLQLDLVGKGGLALLRTQ